MIEEFSAQDSDLVRTVTTAIRVARTALGVREIEVVQASVKTLLDHVDAVAAIDLPLALDTAQFAALYAWPKTKLQRNAVAAWSTLYDRLAVSHPDHAIRTQQSTVYMAAFCPPLRECAEMKLKDGLDTSKRPGLTADDGSRSSLRL